MSVFKIHRYGVRAERIEGRLLGLEAPGKPPLRVATPPEFRDGIPGVWSPEELLIGSLAACYELTAIAIAEYQGVPLYDIRVDGTGHVEHKDGRYQFILFELDVLLESDDAHEHDLEHIAELAEERCIVGCALDVPVRVNVKTHLRSRAAAAV
jgi:organic hydroperoxide reductase OsmC/OhrA